MLQLYRPALYAAAAQRYPIVALNVTSSSQSGPPTGGTLRLQMAALQAVANDTGAASNDSSASADSSDSSGDDDSGDSGGDSGGSSSLLTFNNLTDLAAVSANLSSAYEHLNDSWQQAALAADGQLDSGLEACACVGPDARGRLFWTGRLNSSYLVDGVQILSPLHLAAAGDNSSSSSSSEDSSSGGSGGGDGNSGDGDGAASPPPPLLLPPPPSTAALQLLAVDVYIGSSPSFTANARCTLAPVLLRQPLTQIECPRPLAGQFVSVVAQTSGARAQEQQQQLRQEALCLCEVRPLSSVAPPELRSPDQQQQQLQKQQVGVELPLGAAASAGQSSTLGAAAAAAALAAAGATPGQPPACSATLPEARPRW